MSIRVRRKPTPCVHPEPRAFPDAAALHAAVEAGEVAGTDEYYAPRHDSWVPLDEHPHFSTTDARGIYPAIVHLVVFIKIFIFLAFLAILDGRPEDLLGGFTLYVYAILAGDAVAIALAYANQNKLSAVLLWIFGIASMPLGLFLVIAAGMTRSFRLRPAE